MSRDWLFFINVFVMEKLGRMGKGKMEKGKKENG